MWLASLLKLDTWGSWRLDWKSLIYLNIEKNHLKEIKYMESYLSVS